MHRFLSVCLSVWMWCNQNSDWTKSHSTKIRISRALLFCCMHSSVSNCDWMNHKVWLKLLSLIAGGLTTMSSCIFIIYAYDNFYHNCRGLSEKCSFIVKGILIFCPFSASWISPDCIQNVNKQLSWNQGTFVTVFYYVVPNNNSLACPPVLIYHIIIIFQPPPLLR